jgi:hypothetical protein
MTRKLCKNFKRYFKQKYISDHYYENKVNDFHELNHDQMSINIYETKCRELLKYIKYIKDEKLKINRFLNGSQCLYKNQVQIIQPQ